MKMHIIYDRIWQDGGCRNIRKPKENMGFRVGGLPVTPIQDELAAAEAPGDPATVVDHQGIDKDTEADFYEPCLR